MKDNLIEILLNLFEQSLAQLQKDQKTSDQDTTDLNDEETATSEEKMVYLQSQQQTSTRVFTYEEQMKLSKASYQFLMRMKLCKILNADALELILNQLQFSESRVVTLHETKWTIRSSLAHNLDEEQLAFLDLVLYQAEDELTVH